MTGYRLLTGTGCLYSYTLQNTHINVRKLDLSLICCFIARNPILQFSEVYPIILSTVPMISPIILIGNPYFIVRHKTHDVNKNAKYC